MTRRCGARGHAPVVERRALRSLEIRCADCGLTLLNADVLVGSAGDWVDLPDDEVIKRYEATWRTVS